jgi:biotin-dependent carboxylase-like uncharacterized protein
MKKVVGIMKGEVGYIRIINGGVQSLIEDLRYRWKYYVYGYSPSGAADHYSHSLANLLVGNPPEEATIEIAGGLFEAELGFDGLIAITGADLEPTLNGQQINMWESIRVKKGDILKFGYSAKGKGFRAYLAISGSIDVPLFFGSKSTCVYGKYGGYQGRPLQKGDVINVGSIYPEKIKEYENLRVKSEYIPVLGGTYVVRMIPGPTAAPEYITDNGYEKIYNTNFKINRNSDRSGYRLDTPKDIFPMEWARKSGGVAGLHPSNIVDMGYQLPGGLNVCGDQIIILGPDGPCGGGFVIAGQVIYADVWKVFQGIPGRDYIRFKYSTLEEAIKARRELKTILSSPDKILKRS